MAWALAQCSHCRWDRFGLVRRGVVDRAGAGLAAQASERLALPRGCSRDCGDACDALVARHFALATVRASM